MINNQQNLAVPGAVACPHHMCCIGIMLTLQNLLPALDKFLLVDNLIGLDPELTSRPWEMPS